MQRDLLGPLAIALLCVVAIAVASATLTDPVSTTGFDRDVGTPGSGDDGEWNPLRLNFSDGEEESSGGGGSTNLGPVCYPLLSSLPVQALLVLLLGLLSYQLYRKMGTIGVVAGLAAVLPPGFIIYTYFTTCRPPEMGGAPFGFEHGNATNNSSVGAGAGGSGGGAALDPPILLLVLAGVLAVLLVAAFVRTTGDDAADEEPEPEPEPEEPDLAAVGSVAGEAADRIEGSADVENEVYRAWREMTDLLDVDSPTSSTPAEFEAAALDAGMDRSEVSTLTGVFRDVRYGGREPTPDREERAVEALRAIEDAHAEEVSA